jgi:DNA-binding beta-propeller fold protein YncE
MATDGAGNLYIADTGNGTIRKAVLATAAVTTVVGEAGHQGVVLGALPAGLNAPAGVVALPGGELIIVDSAENALLFVR